MTSLSRPRVEFISTILQTVLNLGLLCLGLILVVGNDSNLLIVFYVQIMPDDFVMQLHRF